MVGLDEVPAVLVRKHLLLLLDVPVELDLHLEDLEDGLLEERGEPLAVFGALLNVDIMLRSLPEALLCLAIQYHFVEANSGRMR